MSKETLHGEGENGKVTRILFVCLGNICRSSAAEEILRQKLIDSGLSERVKVDSAGLINYHEGELPVRMECNVARSCAGRGCDNVAHECAVIGGV